MNFLKKSLKISMCIYWINKKRLKKDKKRLYFSFNIEDKKAEHKKNDKTSIAKGILMKLKPTKYCKKHKLNFIDYIKECPICVGERTKSATKPKPQKQGDQK
jgi:hypothetical protein